LTVQNIQPRVVDEIPPRSHHRGVTEHMIHQEPGIVVKAFTMDAAFRTDAHSHPETQVMVVTSGELHMEIDGVDACLTAGTTLTIPGDASHLAWSDGGRITGLDVIFRPPDAG
jgi:quercetin dioxygenase-like cupin family protein